MAFENVRRICQVLVKSSRNILLLRYVLSKLSFFSCLLINVTSSSICAMLIRHVNCHRSTRFGVRTKERAPLQNSAAVFSRRALTRPGVLMVRL